MTHTKKVKIFCKSHPISKTDRVWLIEKAQEWDRQDKLTSN